MSISVHNSYSGGDISFTSRGYAVGNVSSDYTSITFKIGSVNTIISAYLKIQDGDYYPFGQFAHLDFTPFFLSLTMGQNVSNTVMYTTGTFLCPKTYSENYSTYYNRANITYGTDSMCIFYIEIINNESIKITWQPKPISILAQENDWESTYYQHTYYSPKDFTPRITYGQFGFVKVRAS